VKVGEKIAKGMNMNWRIMRPGRVEKQLKRIAIVYGDNFQEFELDCFFPFETRCNIYRT